MSGLPSATRDGQEGLKATIATVLHDVRWQRCPGHFVRHALRLAPKSAAELVAASTRIIITRPNAAFSCWRGQRVAVGFQERFLKLADLMDDAEPCVPAYLAVPRADVLQM